MLWKHYCIILIFLSCVIGCEKTKSQVNVEVLSDFEKSRLTYKVKNKWKNARPVIVIDAGHGGPDPGGLSIDDSIHLQEKDIVLKISNYIKQRMDTSRFTVIYTRDYDHDYHRHQRTKDVDLWNPDLLLTVHTNWDRDSNINGYEFAYSSTVLDWRDDKDTVDWENPYKEELKKLSQIMYRNTRREFPGMHARHMKERQDRIWMLYGVYYPSLLIEFGFVTGKHDMYVLNSDDSLQMFSRAVVRSIEEYFPREIVKEVEPVDSLPKFGLPAGMKLEEEYMEP